MNWHEELHKWLKNKPAVMPSYPDSSGRVHEEIRKVGKRLEDDTDFVEVWRD